MTIPDVQRLLDSVAPLEAGTPSAIDTHPNQESRYRRALGQSLSKQAAHEKDQIPNDPVEPTDVPSDHSSTSEFPDPRGSIQDRPADEGHTEQQVHDRDLSTPSVADRDALQASSQDLGPGQAVVPDQAILEPQNEAVQQIAAVIGVTPPASETDAADPVMIDVHLKRDNGQHIPADLQPALTHSEIPIEAQKESEAQKTDRDGEALRPIMPPESLFADTIPDDHSHAAPVINAVMPMVDQQATQTQQSEAVPKSAENVQAELLSAQVQSAVELPQAVEQSAEPIGDGQQTPQTDQRIPGQPNSVAQDVATTRVEVQGEIPDGTASNALHTPRQAAVPAADLHSADEVLPTVELESRATASRDAEAPSAGVSQTTRMANQPEIVQPVPVVAEVDSSAVADEIAAAPPVVRTEHAVAASTTQPQAPSAPPPTEPRPQSGRRDNQSPDISVVQESAAHSVAVAETHPQPDSPESVKPEPTTPSNESSDRLQVELPAVQNQTSSEQGLQKTEQEAAGSETPETSNPQHVKPEMAQQATPVAPVTPRDSIPTETRDSAPSPISVQSENVPRGLPTVPAGPDALVDTAALADESRMPEQVTTPGTANAGGAKTTGASTGASTPQLSESRQLELVNRVADAMRGAATSGNRITVRLSPPELGTLQIELSLREGVMTAKLETQSAATQRVLMDNLPQLKESLTQNGTLVDRFVIEQSDDRGRQDASGGDQGGERESPANDHGQDQRQFGDQTHSTSDEDGEQDEPETSPRGSAIEELDIQV